MERTSKLVDRYDAYKATNFPIDASYNIAPGTYNPVIARRSPNGIYLMKWGLVPFWAKDPRIGYKMINARAEDVEKKPSFRKPIRSSRCIIPTSGFYEWKKVNLEGKEEKHPFFISIKGQSIFSFAGIYDVWLDAEKRELLSYAIITTEANKHVRQIHNRMPVILSKNEENKYLNPKTSLQTIKTLLKPYPESKMTSCPVSISVNSTANDNKFLIKRLKK